MTVTLKRSVQCEEQPMGCRAPCNYYSTLPYCTLLYSTLLYATLQYSKLLYSTELHATLLCSTLLYSEFLNSTSKKPQLIFLWESIEPIPEMFHVSQRCFFHMLVRSTKHKRMLEAELKGEKWNPKFVGTFDEKNVLFLLLQKFVSTVVGVRLFDVLFKVTVQLRLQFDHMILQCSVLDTVVCFVLLPLIVHLSPVNPCYTSCFCIQRTLAPCSLHMHIS